MPSSLHQHIKIITFKDEKTGKTYTIAIADRTGYLNLWINGTHFYRNDFASVSPYPTIQGNTYEAHYNMSSSEAQNINIDNIVQAIEDQKPKQTIVIRRRKRG